MKRANAGNKVHLFCNCLRCECNPMIEKFGVDIEVVLGTLMYSDDVLYYSELEAKGRNRFFKAKIDLEDH